MPTPSPTPWCAASRPSTCWAGAGGAVYGANHEKGQPAQGVRPATGINVAFFFTGNDAFGKAARLYIQEFCPDHLQFEASSFEQMFALLDREVPRAVKAAENQRGHIDELIIVSHANALGGMKIPLTDADPKRKFNPWNVAALQKETDNNLHSGFMKKRDQALGAIDAQTRVLVRGCELGKSDEAMEALRVMFGGEATVMAPTEFQGFQIDTVGLKHSKFKTWDQAHDMLVARHYLNPDDLAELDDKELAQLKGKGDAEVLRARKAKYTKERFPDGIPTAFFIVGKEADEAFKAMGKADKLGAKGDELKTWPDDPAIVSQLETAKDGPTEHWAVAMPRPNEVTEHEHKPRSEIVAEAEKLAADWKPTHGGMFLRLWDLWQMPDVDAKTGKAKPPDTSVSVHRTPKVFNKENMRRALNDAYHHPDLSKDAWRTDEMDYKQPANTKGIDHYGSEHLEEQDPETKVQLTENGVAHDGDDRMTLWGFGSNNTSLADTFDKALDDYVRVLGSDDLVTITGHTDSVGAAAANQRLSRHRAERVAAALTNRGVSRERIVTDGVGPSQPRSKEVPGPAGRKARADNRRVEILRTPGWLRPGRS